MTSTSSPSGQIKALASSLVEAPAPPDRSLSGGLILVELNHFFSHHCALPALFRAFREAGPSRFVAYVPLMAWDSGHPTLRYIQGFYESLNVEFPSVKASPSAQHFGIAKQIAVDNLEKFQGSVWNLTDLDFDGFPIGVHLVESILQQFLVPEIEQDLNTTTYAIGLLSRYLWWKDYLATNEVRAVIASHPCYEFALPQLAAMKLGIDSFAWHDNFFYRSAAFLPLPLGNENWMRSLESAWEKTEVAERRMHILNAKDELIRRSFGERVGMLRHDARFQRGGAVVGDVPLMKREGRPAVVIYCHAFSDSPCTLPKGKFGYSCSPLVSTRRLFELLRDEPVDVYVKTHPQPFPQDDQALNNMLLSYPFIKRLPSGLTPQDLKELRVDVIVSGWGSVCYEASFIGLPVIAYTSYSSLSSLGILAICDLNDEGSFHKALVASLLLGIKPESSDRIAEIYAISNYGGTLDLTCSKVEELPREGGQGRYSPYAYKHWAKTLDIEKFKRTVAALVGFLGSDEHVFSRFSVK